MRKEKGGWGLGPLSVLKLLNFYVMYYLMRKDAGTEPAEVVNLLGLYFSDNLHNLLDRNDTNYIAVLESFCSLKEAKAGLQQITKSTYAWSTEWKKGQRAVIVGRVSDGRRFEFFILRNPMFVVVDRYSGKHTAARGGLYEIQEIVEKIGIAKYSIQIEGTYR